MDALELLYTCNANSIYLYVEEEKLKYKQIKAIDINLKKKLFELIKYQKEKIISLLLDNHITSFDVTGRSLIYRVKSVSTPLSFAQERLWFIDQYEEGTNAYNIPIYLELKTNINLHHFKGSIAKIVERHEILRTLIQEAENGKLMQLVSSDSPKINEFHLKEKDFPEQLKSDINYIFKLKEEYPIKITLYHTETNHYVLILIHHIAFDGWSMDIFMNELVQYYQHLSENKALTLTHLTIQYKDFALWQRNYLSGSWLDDEINYWKENLKGYQPVSLLGDKPRPPELCYLGDDVYFEVEVELSTQLRNLANILGVTLYTVLLSGFYILLNKYTDQLDLIVGTLVANRHFPQVEHLVGLFVNTLTLRTQLDPEENIESIIKNVHNNLILVQGHQDLPFERLIEALSIERDPSRNPLAQVFFSVQSFGGKQTLFKEKSTDDYFKVAKFDLSLLIDDKDAVLKGDFNYATSLYERSTIKRLKDHYLIILKQIADYPNRSLKEINVLNKEEYQKIVYEWNQNYRDYPKNKTINELFCEQVEKTPKNIAVIYEHQSLSYEELNQKSNQLARYIRQSYQQATGQALQPDTLIAICVEKSIEMIIGILGILKVGAAYVPIDPNYPSERLHYIITDTQAKTLLTQSHIVGKVEPYFKHQIIILDQAQYQAENLTNMPPNSKAHNLAYVIYTSGTTGQPKGVMIEHRSVLNTLCAQIDLSRISEQTVTLQFASFTFDASVWEIFTSLLSGSKLILSGGSSLKVGESLEQDLVNYKISLLTLSPSILKILPTKKYSHIKTIITAGEASSKELINQWVENHTYINAYGPTEASICASAMVYTKKVDQVSIGKALPNVKLYVLGHSLQPLPIGVAGELYIGGAGIARGYLNHLELTRERFIDNPFATEEDKKLGYDRLYKTGDLVRWLPDGNLEYIGRNDFQVKLRGYRIELGEIESDLNAFHSIQQSVVVLKERAANKYLVAYYVADKPIKDEVLIEHLSKELPDYMIPGAFVYLEKMPLSSTGKIDRKSLPEPTFEDKGKYVAPRNALEEQLVEVWKQVLHLDEISVLDDFFRLGGDSILSIQLTSRLRHMSLHVSVRDIFDYRTIANIVSHVALEKKRLIMAEEGLLTGSFDLLPIQYWFFDQNFMNFNYFNQSFLIKVPPLNIEKLKTAIIQLSQQHDVLRLVFNDKQQTYQQSIVLPELAVLNRNSLNEKALIDIFTSWQSKFNIMTGPLWKIGYIEGYSDGSARIYVALHHLIVDAVAWRILTEDIKNLYAGKKLGEKTSSYRQWVEAVKTYAHQHENESDYWQMIIKNQPNYWQKQLVSQEQHFDEIKLSVEKTRELLQVANLAYHTEINDLLLTALAYALRDWHEENQSFITLEGHGREEINEAVDVSRTVGWFTTMYPIRLSLQASIAESIKHIKEELHGIPQRGIGYSALKNYGHSEQLKHHVLPAISFNYLGQFGGATVDNWLIVAENSGANYDPKNEDISIINIVGWVIEDQLRFSIISSLNKDQNKRLSQSLQSYLEAVIDHCITRVTRKELVYTPSDFSTIKLSSSLLDQLQSQYQITDIYPANSLQQGFIYHAMSYPEDDAYRVQILWDYFQAIDANKLKQAWDHAIRTYPGLRVCFNWQEEIIQIINKKVDIHWYEYNLSKDADKAREIEVIREEDRKQPFVLKKPGLLRLHLIKQDNDLYTCMLSTHHSILDGWSHPLLLNHVHAVYQLLLTNKRTEIAEEAAYLRAQEYYYQHRKEAKVYWQMRMQLVESTNDLNNMLSRPGDLDQMREIIQPGEMSVSLTGTSYERLKEISKEQGVTLNVLLQFAWHKLIQVYTNDDLTIVGTTVSGRTIPIAGIEESVGLYINTLPLIIDWSEKTVEIQLQAIHRAITELNNHTFIDLASLQKEGRRLFHSLLVYENYPIPEEQKGGIKIKLRKFVEKLDYPLSITAFEQEGLHIQLKYAREYLTEEQANRLLSQIQWILQQLPDAIHQSHHQLHLVNTAEYQKVVYDWNQTYQDYPQDKTIVDLFYEQVEKNPYHIAITFENQSLTYRELNEKSNQLARYIRKTYQQESGTELKPDTLIAICVERSLQMIIGILSILKAGGAYVPIDPKFPPERIQYMLSDSKVNLLLTQTPCLDELQIVLNELKPTPRVILVDQDWISISREVINNLNKLTQSNHLSYVIYTSGTTGHPKGVLVDHRNVVSLFFATDNFYAFTDKDVWSLFHSFSFDFSVWEIFGALLSSGKLAIVPYWITRSPDDFYQFIIDQQVTILNQTPSAFSQLINVDLLKMNKNLSLRKVIFGGEALNFSILKPWIELHPDNPQLVNMYGITETTVHVSYYKIDKDNLAYSQSVIGKQLPNLFIYVLNQNLQPVPINVIGELYVGGAQVSRGYLNRPELTKERFIENHFATEKDKELGYDKLYKTGDLVRWLENGNLEYIGRNDFQVKIRGFRIELGEIESDLNEFPAIKQSVVLAKEREEAKYLVAYYVADKIIKDEILIEYLAKELPDYMIPSAFVYLEKMPLTNTGKIDRKSLPEPTFEAKEKYVAPRNVLEEQLVEIWKKILHLEKISVFDNFFRLGGDSIISIRLISLINQELNCNFTVRDIFELKTIAKLAEIIDKTEPHVEVSTPYTPFSLVNLESYRSIVSDLSQVDDIYPASYLQTGMLIESDLKAQGTYHDVFLYGVKARYQEEKFLTLWESLTKKHELLRAGFFLMENGWNIIIYKKINIKYKFYDQKDSNQLLATESLNSFIEGEPGLFRLLVNDQGESFHFLFSFHHVIADGWSIASLINEFITTYLHNKPIQSLPKLHYGEFIRNELSAINNLLHIDFWKKYLSEFHITKVNWKFDDEKSEKGLYTANFLLNAQQSQAVHELARKHSTSVDCIFLLAYMKTLGFFLNENEITVGIVMNNRLEKDEGDKLFGLFLNTVPLRMDLKKIFNDIHSLSTVFEEKLKLLQHKQLPYGYIKSLFNSEFLYFCFNFVHFHILKESQRHIKFLNGYEKTNIPFVLNVMQEGISQFSINMTVRDDYISDEFLKYFILYYKKCLNELLKNSFSKLTLTAKDYHRIIQTWNQTYQDYPKNKTIVELFYEQVEKSPYNTAVMDEHQSLSYEELNQKSNQLARYIRQSYQQATGQVLRPDTLIAICVEKSIEMIIGILGILKVGAAYVPIDPNYPSERLHYIITDTQAKTLLTQSHLVDRVKPYFKHQIIILDQAQYQAENLTNMPPNCKAHNLAYVIYTSGSTGEPKGVDVKQQGVVRLVKNTNYIDIKENDHIAQLSNIAFDAATFEIWGALLNGASLIIFSQEDMLNSQNLINHLKKNKVNVMWLTSSLFNQLVDIGEDALDALGNLKYLLIGGEALSVNHINRLLQEEKKPRFIINGYGPTENTTFTTYYLIDTVNMNSIPIGKPIANTQVYVLDKELMPVPIGTVGELYAGGAGIARGYLNHPELTRERFIDNPFATEEDKKLGYDRLYKTGDLVRWLPDGNLEYIGRNDFQVKMRGYRIELGEIESDLTTFHSIQQSVVVLKERAENKYLVAYYVADKPIKDEILIEHLSKELPDYMIPSAFVYLEKMPLSSTGKIDRKSLPEPTFEDKGKYVAPKNALEEQLVEVWKQVLHLDKIGVKDDFFKLGGNSILAIRLLAKFPIAIKISEFFSLKTIENIVKFWKSKIGYQPIVSLNTDRKQENILFMIHPSAADSEVYINLAKKLEEKYYCYGVDNYNLHHSEKLDDLSALAKLYLNNIEVYNKEKTNYFLLAWSLGGQIAMEIAYLLEQQGVKNIVVYLLDTLLPDDFVREERKKNYALMKSETELTLQKKFDQEYVKDIMLNYDTELTLADQNISGRLEFTKLILFKATEATKESLIKFESFILHILSLKDNNLGYYSNDFQIINLPCTHETILQEIETLIEAL